MCPFLRDRLRDLCLPSSAHRRENCAGLVPAAIAPISMSLQGSQRIRVDQGLQMNALILIDTAMFFPHRLCCGLRTATDYLTKSAAVLLVRVFQAMLL
ncbi:MAG TPA: hypothetical protein PK940_07380 [Rectinema sp.]|nr:hypothetical protein [Rectinema sp.]HOR92063.1 hypothetical protein [Rectinema sp.]HQJ22945.1 hypothetical protein [Rectinema sp.]HRU78146.1 hypothetical protein [Rectinema sp.]